MREINIDIASINIQALDGALRAALSDVFVGLSTGPSSVTVYLTDNASDEQEQQARDIVEGHDPMQLTPEQQAEIERQQQLAELREANSEPFAMGDYDAQPSLIQQMAQRIAWLELEIADLRR